MFLKKNLWTIYEVVKEECHDGDTFEPGPVDGLALFVAALEGRKGTGYRCMADVDRVAALAEWKENYPAIKRQYEALVLRDGPALRRMELARAFQAKDREKFDAIVEEGLALVEA